MNNFKVEIFNAETFSWEDYTKKAIFPLTNANLLDEQLDEAQIELKRVKKAYFLPNTIVRVTILNTPSAKFNSDFMVSVLTPRANNFDIAINSKLNEDGTVTQEQVIYYLIANDNGIEKPIKSGFYEHKLYLIEITKIMEGFIGDSITFTNPLGNNYT